MAKQRASLETMMQAAQEPAAQPKTQAAGAPQQARVVELVQPPQAAPAEKPRAVRKDKPHTTLYLGKKARKVVKEIALHYDTTPQALYLEGIDMMLAKYGRPSLKTLEE